MKLENQEKILPVDKIKTVSKKNLDLVQKKWSIRFKRQLQAFE